MPDLRVRLLGMELKNPLIIASGIPSTKILSNFIHAGVAAVTTKTVTPEPREGHPPPTIAKTPCGYVNAVGLKNPGIEAFLGELKELKEVALKEGAYVIGSVAAGSVEGYVRVASKVEEGGVDAVEVNVSCPTVREVFSASLNLKYLSEIVREVRSVIKVPLIVKLSPAHPDIAYVAKIAVDAGADCIAAINTVTPALVIDVETGKPLLGNPEGFGGLSGPAIKPIALAKVLQIAREVDVPIIGMGGVTGWKDVIEMMMVGASAVGILTAYFIHSNVDFIPKILKGLENYLRTKKLKSIDQIRGLTLKYVR